VRRMIAACALLYLSCSCATQEEHDELYLVDAELLDGDPPADELLADCRRSSDHCMPVCRRLLTAIFHPFVEIDTIERCELVPAGDREALSVRYVVRLCPREKGPGAPTRTPL
jgi:hypothetical protein